MKLSKVMLMATVLPFVLGVTACSTMEKAENGYYKQKVVYHVNDVNKATGAFRNAKNHLNAVGDKNVDMIIVTHSSGAFALVDQIATLANRGVRFQICANTIRGKKIDKNKINVNAEVVPSGVAQIADLEQKGYLYVKP